MSPRLPPENLDNLRALLDTPPDGTPLLRPGSRSGKALTAMLAQPGFVAVASITELAERFGVNASTLSRLAQRLGFSGFGTFQELFRQTVPDSGEHFYSDQASRLIEARADHPDLLGRIGIQEVGNIGAMMNGVDATDFERASGMLARARRVRIHGLRQFHALGYFMAYALGMIRGDVATLDAGPQGLADALAPLGPGDLLVVASCFPYTPGVITAAAAARRNGLDVIALTDSPSSPLAADAGCSFFVPNHSAFYSNGMAGFFVLAEALLAETASQLGVAALEALRRRESLINDLSPMT